MVSFESPSLLIALTPCLPLQLREDREGPCLPTGRVPGASLWHLLTRGSSIVDVTLAEPHLGDCPLAAGSCQPTLDASPGDRKHRLPHLPKCQQSTPRCCLDRGWGRGGVALGPADVCSPIPTATPSGWKKIQEIISFLLFLSLRLFEKYIFFHASRKLILFMFWRSTEEGVEEKSHSLLWAKLGVRGAQGRGRTVPAQAWTACLTLQPVIWLRHGSDPRLDHPGLPPESRTHLCWVLEVLGCLATLLRPSQGAPTRLHMQGGWSPHPALQEAPSFPGLSSPLPEGPSIKHKPENKIPETKL